MRPLTPPPPVPPPARPPTAAPRLPPPPRGPAPPPPREGRWDRAADASLSEEDCPALRAANLEPELYPPPPGLKKGRRRPRGKPKQTKKLPYWQTRLAAAAEKPHSPELKADLRALGRGGEPALRAAADRLGWNRPWALLACLLARAREAGATSGSDLGATGLAWDSLLGAALGVLLGLTVLAATLRSGTPRPRSSRRRAPGGPNHQGTEAERRRLASTRGVARRAGRQRLQGLRAFTRRARRRRDAAAERSAAELALHAARKSLGGSDGPPAGYRARAWRRREARAGRTEASEALERGLLHPGYRARCTNWDFPERRPLPAAELLGRQNSSRRRATRDPKESRALRSWQRAAGWLLLALVALPVLNAGWLGLPRRTPGAPGGHRGERVGEAKNPGPEPETTRAWDGLAQLLTGEQPRKRFRGKQKQPGAGGQSGASSSGAAGSSTSTSSRSGNSGDAGSSTSTSSRSSNSGGAKNHGSSTPLLGTAAAGLGPGARGRRAAPAEVGAARDQGTQPKVRARWLEPFPPAAFAGCPRCAATRAQGCSPGPGPLSHAKKADGTPAPGCFLSGLQTGGEPFGQPGPLPPRTKTTAAAGRVCAAQNSQESSQGTGTPAAGEAASSQPDSLGSQLRLELEAVVELEEEAAEKAKEQEKEQEKEEEKEIRGEQPAAERQHMHQDNHIKMKIHQI